MSKIARILSNPVVAKIEGIDDNTKIKLSDAMSYVVDGHEHMNLGGWDGRSTLYDWASGKFPSGFIPTAIAILTQEGYQPQQVKHPLPEPLGPKPTPAFPIVDDFPEDPNRAYQFRTVNILERHGSFIARVATGGGKSRIAALCITRIGRKTAFVTTRQVLLYQMGRALEEADRKILEKLSDLELLQKMGSEIASKLKGIKISYIGDGSWDTSGDVVLSMVQSLADRLAPFQSDPITQSAAEIMAAQTRWQKRYDEVVTFCDSIEFLIAEEAHEAGGNGYFEVCKAMRRAHYRLALTATPMMRDGESNVRLIAMFGPIRIEVTEKQLIDCGILARPFFKYIEMKGKKQPPTLRPSTAWQKAEELGVMNNHNRNKHVCAEVIRASRWGLSSMVLVKRKKHGEIIHKMLQQYGLKGAYIFGDSDQKKREDALHRLGTGEYDYVIGSTILDVGVDVPSIGLLVLAGGGKAEVATRQRIGRGLRQKKAMPNFAFVVDFDDGTNKHLIKHAKTRRKIVEDTPGFAEGILPRGADFDFAGLGFRRPAVGLAA
jgi:superfamily II DNA or RNA helicase